LCNIVKTLHVIAAMYAQWDCVAYIVIKRNVVNPANIIAFQISIQFQKQQNDYLSQLQRKKQDTTSLYTFEHTILAPETET
ncbi:hypothetical protein DOY81_003986, partial [Sarcophaga bullata]